MQKKVHRRTKKNGGLSIPHMQQMRDMATTAGNHLAKAQQVMNTVTAHPAVKEALAHPTVQGHVNTAVSALSSAAQKVPHPLASTLLNRAATTVGTTLQQRGGKRSATKKAKRSRRGKKH
jgi:hypothetical protein